MELIMEYLNMIQMSLKDTEKPLHCHQESEDLIRLEK